MERSPSDKMVRPTGKYHVLKRAMCIGNHVFEKGDVVRVGKYPELDAKLKRKPSYGIRRSE